MKTILLLMFCLTLPLIADEEEECPGSEVFAGAVKEIKSGECKGKWGLETFIGDFYPVDLPFPYQYQYARVRGCFHRLPEKGCSVEGHEFKATSIESIIPD